MLCFFFFCRDFSGYIIYFFGRVLKLFFWFCRVLSFFCFI